MTDMILTSHATAAPPKSLGTRYIYTSLLPVIYSYSHTHAHTRLLRTPMAPSLLTRHPRYVALLAAATLTTIYLLFPTRSSPSPPLSLRAVLEREERLYAETLERRAEMVRRWGPTPENVTT